MLSRQAFWAYFSPLFGEGASCGRGDGSINVDVYMIAR